jgi:hypothetical protein
VFAAPFLARPIALSAHAGLMPLLSLALLAIVVRRAIGQPRLFPWRQPRPYVDGMVQRNQ